MANEREIFTVLEDSVTGSGVAQQARQEGDSPASINGSLGFSFKDSSGNVVLPQLDVNGALPVSFDSGACIDGASKDVAAVVNSFVDVITLSLSLLKNYSKLEFSASCTQTTHWEIVYIDDVGGTPTETLLHSFITGAGQFSYGQKLECAEFNTNAGTGVQNLVLRGKQLRGTASDLHGYMAIREN